MKQVFRSRKGAVVVDDVPPPRLRENTVLVKVLYSLISSGTELRSLQDAQKKGSTTKNLMNKQKHVRSILGKALKVDAGYAYRSLKSKADALASLGYSCVGEVIDKDSSLQELEKGNIVVCGGYEYAHHAEVVCVPKNMVAKVPDGLDLKEAVFSPVGGIALHAVRRAQLGLGERVLVIGLGLIGQMVVQLLTLQGCRVIGVDPHSQKIKLAKQYGAIGCVLGKTNIVSKVKKLNDGHSFDAAILCTKINDTQNINEIIDVVRSKGKIIAVGDLATQYPFSKLFRKEIDILITRSHGPGRFEPEYEQGASYPLQHIRWTSDRNIKEVLNLLSEKKLSFKNLISKEFVVGHAKDAYNHLRNSPGSVCVLLSYNPKKALKSRLHLHDGIKKQGNIGVALAGIGAHANKILLPDIIKQPSFHLQSVVSSHGVRAKEAAKIFNAQYCTTDYEDVLNDPDVDLVFISTKNNQHADMAVRAAEAKKHIFLEKPLALTEKECKNVVDAVTKNNVIFTLGLSRRFSSLVERAKKSLAHHRPMVINYTLVENSKPEKKWVDEQGGRIIYMFCHLIDVATCFIQSEPSTVYAKKIDSQENTVVVTVTFSNGSLLNIIYRTVERSLAAQERIEIHQDNTFITLKNFQEFHLQGTDQQDDMVLPQVDKGHTQQIINFVDVLHGRGGHSITLRDAVRATIFPFRVLESLHIGNPVAMNVDKFLP